MPTGRTTLELLRGWPPRPPKTAHQSLYPSLVFDCIEAYAPGFKASVIGRDILVPPDLERIFGLPGGVGTMWAKL